MVSRCQFVAVFIVLVSYIRLEGCHGEKIRVDGAGTVMGA
jgi:hypothetical protein